MSTKKINVKKPVTINIKWISEEMPTSKFTYLTDNDYKLVEFEEIEKLWEEDTSIIVDTKYHLITNKLNLESHLKQNKLKKIYDVNISEFKKTVLDDNDCFSKEDYNKEKKSLYSKIKKEYIKEEQSPKKKSSNESVPVRKNKTTISVESDDKKVRNRDKSDIAVYYGCLSTERMLDVSFYAKTGQYKTMGLLKTNKSKKKFSPGLRIASSDIESYIEAANKIGGDNQEHIDYVTKLFNEPEVANIPKKKEPKKKEPFTDIKVITDTSKDNKPTTELFETVKIEFENDEYTLEINLEESDSEKKEEEDENQQEEEEEEEEEEEVEQEDE